MKTCIRNTLLTIGLVLILPAAHASPHQDAQLLPSGSSVVVQLDFQSLQKSDVYRSFVALNPMVQQQLNVARNQFDFDLSKELGVLTIGINADAYLNGNQDESVIIILNPALPKKVSFFEKMAGGKLKTIQHGQNQYKRLGEKGPKTTAVANYKGRTVIAKEDVLKTILDGKETLSDHLSESSKNRKKDAQLWMFAVPPKQMAGALPFPMQTAHFSLTITKDIHLALSVQTNPESAKNFVDEFNRQRSAFESHPTLKEMGLGQAVRKLSIQQTNGLIKASVALTMKDVETIMSGVRTTQAKQPTTGTDTPGLPAAPTPPKPSPSK